MIWSLANIAASKSIGRECGIAIVWMALSVLWMRVMKVFRRGSIEGPVRAVPGDPIGWLIILCLAGFFVRELLARLIIGSEIDDERQKLFAQILSTLITIPAMILIDRVGRGRSARMLGLDPRDLPRGLIDGLLGFLTVMPAVLLASIGVIVVGRVMHWPEPPAHKLLELLKQNPDPQFQAMVGLTAVVLAPILEEVLCRGFLQTALVTATRSRWLGIIFTSAFFAAIHIEWQFIPPIFVLSIGLGYLYERTGNLWSNIALHAMFNGFQLIWFASQMGN